MPRLIYAKFPGRCYVCEAPIVVGEKALRMPDIGVSHPDCEPAGPGEWGKLVPAGERVRIGSTAALYRLFDRMKKSDRRPLLRLGGARGPRMMIYPAGIKSKFCGTLCVSGEKFGEPWYGYVTRGGLWVLPARMPLRACERASAERLLRALVCDPEGVAERRGAWSPRGKSAA